MKISRVAIVGGGTAGWLAANHLGKALFANKTVSVDVIESPNIAPIGVGEGTVPEIRRTLKHFGISEADLIRECDVTFKQSIKFVNWLNKGKHGDNNFYHHLFEKPYKFSELQTNDWLNHHANDSNTPFAQHASFQHDLCEAGKAPKLITTPEYESAAGYAYHFDASKFAKLLAKNAIQRFGIDHLQATVEQVHLTQSGGIKSLKTTELGEIKYDFYIDCSGFHGLLLDKALKVPFVDKGDSLFVDKALAVQVPTDGKSAIPPYTLATAHQAGWIWDITLPNRRGVGLVYSSKHLSGDMAHQKLRHYVGAQIDNLTVREIPMRIGYREKFWHQNCVALGLAQGFVEPLEATSILLTDFAASFLAKRFPFDSQEFDFLETRYNETVGYAWQRTIDFIKLHYYLSDRDDSEFWRDNREESLLSETLKERLSLWKCQAPISEDFFSKFEVFDLDNYLYVLYGMRFKSTSGALNVNNDRDDAKRAARYLEQAKQQLLTQLPEHRALIEKIIQHGLQKI
ncbi:tryptophan halogenase family protein [Thalassotalea euphylliae]|uniref:tryptophan halogenase family protein n=1 Tax=Thalassotalea euphylliae TaxID=1655234 RepID=UPI00362D174D